MYLGAHRYIYVEICSHSGICCSSGRLATARADFVAGLMDTFYGSAIGDCDGMDVGEGEATVVVTHTGDFAWSGEWIR